MCNAEVATFSDTNKPTPDYFVYPFFSPVESARVRKRRGKDTEI